ncbi:glycosyltransferase family 2 protein [Brumimicrobium mesophilum]|uniref:glycosyltransferase family 2 protein n=1 Tax=Brumimicrobium mesophilum TaxID=392717 RepID=UPI000D14007C|nr:glycosyltransferase family 2 protein [Brumimicrobium mesophilum]
MPKISVICPTYNEEKYIEKCIDSMLFQDIDKSDIELLFVDGRSTDKTREIINRYHSTHPFIQLIDNPERTVPFAMNYGIDAAKGDIIMRIDAHSHFEANYVSVLSKALIELDATNVGAVCQTDVINKTPKSLAIREVLSNKFGVGNSMFRLGIEDVTQVDTVPFGCYKKEVFEEYGLYNPKLTRNQDIELNKRILRNGGKIYLVPDTYCTYFAREDYGALAKNNFQNGKWNILMMKYTKNLDSLSIRHFIPFIFVMSMLVPTLLSLIWFPFIFLALLSIFAYSTLITFISLKISSKENLNLFYLFFAFITLHLSYGTGSLMGLIQLITKK